MTPLQRVAMGLVIVALDTLSGFDLLPDPIGWALVLWGVAALPLPERGGLLGAAAVAGLVSAVLWLPMVQEPLREAELALRWAASLPELLFVFLLARAVGAAAGRQQPPDRKFAGRFGTLIWAVVIVAALPPVADAADSDQLITAGQVGFQLLWLWLIWNLFAAHARDYVRPAGDDQPSSRSSPST